MTEAKQSLNTTVTQLQNRASDLLKNSDYHPDLPHTGATQRQGECVPLSDIVLIAKLPTFTGDILEFHVFWGKFQGAVHRMKNFDNITKFVRLRSCLSGVAPQLINGLIITAENYESVIRLLHDQFHRTTDILDANIMRLLGIQQATSHNRKELSRLHKITYRRNFSISILFRIPVMADDYELCLVLNRGGSMPLVHEGRAYTLKHTDEQKKHWKCSKACPEC
ncbi:hypothetical protein T09_3531 [Trichinella sp. T9]|nr:hypothetical protein T09_3531 [Trichinella sp. T9]